MALHWNVKCDGCGKTNLLHYRYKCLRCTNYDLCSVCYENKVETGRHSKGHPFQCLLDRAARELFFAGQEIPDLCADSFTCPICGKMGHSVKELVKHVQAKHRGDITPVICPLCIAVPAADCMRINNLVNHVSLTHGAWMSILRIGGGAGGGGGGGNSPVAPSRTTGFELPPIHRTHSHQHPHPDTLCHSHSLHAAAAAETAAELRRQSRRSSPPPLPPLRNNATNQWLLSGSHSVGGSSASQEEDDGGSIPDSIPESWLPELSSLSGSMHTMRDQDLETSGGAASDQPQPQQLRRATPLAALHLETLSPEPNQQPEDPNHVLEDEFSDLDGDADNDNDGDADGDGDGDSAGTNEPSLFNYDRNSL
ncbi:CG3526 [Drosophila busckii]|uniref:E3 ubiquitin-protein ligase KCMF1 n=1 Tax=Drosophila busckii TaxID=30019 RepID=A0A0M4ESD1_DROBS|nr:E3 ubiquitin-protein ligase Kcmf1 [Drosophila busckii]ALC48201.1 CG3526 [Drosophila busckii]